MEQIITISAQEKINEFSRTESNQYLKLVKGITTASNNVVNLLATFRTHTINENSLLIGLPDSVEDVKHLCGELESILDIEAFVNYDTKQIRFV